VKVNAVLLRETTPRQLENFLRFSDEHGVEVRFIELMPIFGDKEFFHRNFIAVDEVMALIEARGLVLEPEGDGAAAGNRTGYGPATTFAVQGTRARHRLHQPDVEHEVRAPATSCALTSDGALKPCLLSPQEEDLAPAGEVPRPRGDRTPHALSSSWTARSATTRWRL
jgi:cyclic pyranopterin phosphate synthase